MGVEKLHTCCIICGTRVMRVVKQLYTCCIICGTRVIGCGTAVYVLHYIKRDQGEGVMEQQYTCCII